MTAEKTLGVSGSTSNLPNVKTLVSGYSNVRDLLGYDKLLLSKDAVDHLELWLTPANGAVEEVDVIEDADGAPEGTEG